MGQLITFEDIFVVGIGFDIAGAYLLAKGLLLSSEQIHELSSTYVGFSPRQIIGRADDKISSTVGVLGLIAGFVCQLIGYVLNLALGSTAHPSSLRAAIAICLAGLTVVVVLGGDRIIRPWWRRRLLVDIAHYSAPGSRQGRPFGSLC